LLIAASPIGLYTANLFRICDSYHLILVSYLLSSNCSSAAMPLTTPSSMSTLCVLFYLTIALINLSEAKLFRCK
jgi:hypothetical protein